MENNAFTFTFTQDQLLNLIDATSDRLELLQDLVETELASEDYGQEISVLQDVLSTLEG